MSPTSCVWTKPAAPPICFGGTAGHRAARASTTTPPAGAGRPARFSPRAGHGADRTGGLRRRDRWRELPRLHRPDPGAAPAARRHRHGRHTLGAHKVAGIQRAIQAAGATLWYLPPYSPDLNPIELCFAKLKALVRTARCRSTETLWPFLGECLAHFSPDDCRNYVRHCGYSAATRS